MYVYAPQKDFFQTFKKALFFANIYYFRLNLVEVSQKST